jgi:serine/threonine-protein kinase
MLLSCHSCHKEYVASHKTTGQPFICSKCQGRHKESPSQTKLGLHPALERKLANATGEGKKDRYSPVAPKNDMNSLPQIPGFDIAYQVGRGAMGSVYRAREKKSGRLVAIKVLSQELSLRGDLVARFEREAYALKSLTDKNVVTIIDAGHVEDLHYFVMEFIEGITLRARINRGPLSLLEAAFITSSILHGLKAAHKHGIIHRDLKPENVLLAYDNSDFSSQPQRVVLVDFGLVGIGALVFDPHPNLTRSRVTMGTVNYMAPEQHIDAKRVDHRSDLYSAGVIFFEMLTGDLPLGRYLMPSERDLDLPKSVDIILANALAPNVDQRYASADDFIKELESSLCEQKDEQPKQTQDFLGGRFTKLYNKIRYPFLLIIAASFFAAGIKLSLSKNSVPLTPKTHIINKKNTP